MTQATAKDYWIARNVIHIQENALGQPNYMQVSVATGASILCYMQGVAGLGYDNGHNYRRWTLQAAPTLFNSNTPKYIYVAIPREGSDPAWLVYPSEELDLYGQNAAGEQIGDIAYYYIYLQAWLTATDGSNLRELRGTIVTGMLSTDEALMTRDAEWYRYSTVDEQVSFLKKIYMTANSWFTNLRASAIHLINRGRLIFGESDTAPYIDTIADTDTALDSETAIVTPAYGESQWLSKTHDDTATGKLTFKALVTIGNEASQRTPSTRMLDLHGSTRLTGGFTIGERFNKGIEGGHCDQYANAELNSLVLRESLTVPKIIFEKTEVTAGNTWHCSGGGKIKRVWENVNVLGNNVEGYGIVELDLVDGEIGAVANNDICQGVWHMQSGNDTANSDSKNGNFSFAGFKTIYFLVHQVIDKTRISTYKANWEKNLKPRMGEEAYNEFITDVENSLGLNRFFFYRTRASRGQISTTRDTPFTDTTAPQPQMDFAAYGNTSSAARQSAFLETTQYALLLANVSSWNYNSDNFQYIRGDLSGFNIRTTKDGTKALTGYGIAFGKAYMWGNIVQFDRDPSIVSQQLYYLTTNQSSGVTTSTPGWKTDYTPTSPEKPYLWQYYLITYDNGNTEPTTPFIAANYASDGTGIEIRGHADEVMEREDWFDEPEEWFDESKIYLVKADTDVAFLYYYDSIRGEWDTEDAKAGDTYIVGGHLYAASLNQYRLLDWLDCGNIKGEKGDSGQNAIVYEVECALTSWKKEDGETDASLYLVKINGSKRTRMTYAEVQSEGISVSVTGHTAWIDFDDTDQQIFYADDATGTATITFRKQGMVIASHTFTVSKDGAEGAPGSPGNRGSSFRTLRWEEVKQGDQLYARQQIVGEDLTLCDVVIYTDPEGTKTKWLCIKDYTREASDIPSLLPEYFKAFNQYQNVATEVLLADIANINQLQVDKVLIYDTDGNKRVDMSPDGIMIDAPIIDSFRPAEPTRGNLHVIDSNDIHSIVIEDDPYNPTSTILLPTIQSVPLMPSDIVTTPLTQSGVNLKISYADAQNLNNWANMDEVYMGNADHYDDLKRFAIIICADPWALCQQDNDPRMVHQPNGAYPGICTAMVNGRQVDADWHHGRMFVNGSACRFLALLPGMTLHLVSRIVPFDNGYGEQENALVWDVINGSDFVNSRFRCYRDTTYTGEIGNIPQKMNIPRGTMSDSEWSDPFFVHPLMNSDLIVHPRQWSVDSYQNTWLTRRYQDAMPYPDFTIHPAHSADDAPYCIL